MKKRFQFLLLSALFVCFTAVAQNPERAHRDGSRGERQFPNERMIKELSLTETQITELKKVNDDFSKQRNLLRENTDMQQDAKMERMKQLRREHKEAIEKCLTPDQITKWKEIREERADNMRNKRMDGMKEREFPGDRMIKELALSDKQVSDLQQIKSDFMGQRKALKDNKELSREARMEQMKQLMEKEDGAIEKVLTTEQAQKWKEMRKAAKEQMKQRHEMKSDKKKTDGK